MSVIEKASGAVSRGKFAVGVLRSSGLLAPEKPSVLVGAAKAMRRWDRTIAGGITSAAVRHGDATYISDELGELSFNEVAERTNALTNALIARGVGPDDSVAIMCRNSRYFVEATIAASKLGATALLLNTAFAGPQLVEVLEREKPSALIYDEEFEGLLEGADENLIRVFGWTDGEFDADTVESLVAGAPRTEPPPPDKPGRQIILTSGTTGTPKGARRPPVSPLQPVLAVLSVMPLRTGQTHFVVAPLFHSWGFAHYLLGLILGCKLVLRRKFDPEGTLAGIAESKANSAPMVPVMAQRILRLPNEVRARYDCSSLEAIPLGGSALGGELATEVQREFGLVAFNSYGSTEVGLITTATPRDLDEVPGTAGAPLPGIVLKLLDDDGREVPRGETGRIFAATEVEFEGYTGGGGKQMVDGLMSTGDVGHIDGKGRLFVSGRDDEMIVSGGENVFPREVEDLLAARDDVAEVAVIGVPDEEFGQRLLAFAVAADGASPGEEELKDHVKANLARYKVPREIRFIDELPRNATGKVLKRVLKEEVGG